MKDAYMERGQVADQETDKAVNELADYIDQNSPKMMTEEEFSDYLARLEKVFGKSL